MRLCGGDFFVWGIPGSSLSHVLWTATTCLKFRRLAKIGILLYHISSKVVCRPADLVPATQNLE